MTETMTGGCQCGAVRFSCTHSKRDAYFCHCRMCQRAVGNVAAAFWNVPQDSVTWSGAERATFMSSPFGRRGFCGACGTPISFEYLDGPNVDLTVGALDHPETLMMTSHFGIENRLHGWTAGEDLPSMKSEDYAPLQKRWATAVRSTE